MADEQKPRTLVLGYGNVDRGDDGVGYHVVNLLAQHFGHSGVEAYSDLPEELTENVGALFGRQLTPEMAEILTEYDRVIFVDAHTGAYDEELRAVEVEPGYVPAALTHHLTAETLLALTEVMFGGSPKGYLYSARGYEFEFSNDLSQRTQTLVERVVEGILALIGE
jgi:hydrogenase maturation protease